MEDINQDDKLIPADPAEKAKEEVKSAVDDLNIRQHRFVQAIIAGVPGNEAVLNAGYRPKDKVSAKAMAVIFMNREKIRAAIEEIKLKKIGQADALLNVLSDLASSTETKPSERIKAAEVWLGQMDFRGQASDEKKQTINVKNLLQNISK